MVRGKALAKVVAERIRPSLATRKTAVSCVERFRAFVEAHEFRREFLLRRHAPGGAAEQLPGRALLGLRRVKAERAAALHAVVRIFIPHCKAFIWVVKALGLDNHYREGEDTDSCEILASTGALLSLCSGAARR